MSEIALNHPCLILDSKETFHGWLWVIQCAVMDVFKWDLWVTPVTQTLPSVTGWRDLHSDTEMWACCNSSLSHWQSVWALQHLSEAQTGLLWPLYDMALHKISGKELSASWHPYIADFFKPQSSACLSGKLCRRCFDEPLSQELHRSKKHSITSPPHDFSSLLCAPHLSLVPVSWWLWLRRSLQGSRLACTPSCAIRLSPPFLHRPFNSGYYSPFLQAASLLPASPSCSSKHSPPLPYLLYLQAPQQTFLPAPSRNAFLPLPTRGLARISAMRLFLGDHLCCPDANSQCQLRSGTARLQEGSRHDFYCLRFYLGGLVHWFIFSSLLFPQRSVFCYLCEAVHITAQTGTHTHTYQTTEVTTSLNMHNVQNILLPELSKVAGYHLELTCGSWLCENIFSLVTWYISWFLGFLFLICIFIILP